MPAIVDPDGPDGQPISVFESGAILQYLAGKTGRFGGDTPRGRVAVSEWLFWQMGGLGPMAGQANHFRVYASEKIPYAIDRYTNEVNRLFGVMNRRLADHEFLAGPYSIADMACVGWTKGWKRYGQEISDFPNLARWLDAMLARPAVQRGLALDIPGRQQHDLTRKPARSCSASARDRRLGKRIACNGRIRRAYVARALRSEPETWPRG
jgi:GSH-dependent disulfide-bond oxidoreductase